MEKVHYTDAVVRAHSVSTPIIAVETQDQYGALITLTQRFEAEITEDKPKFLFMHDILRGLSACTPASDQQLKEVVARAIVRAAGEDESPDTDGPAIEKFLAQQTTSPSDALVFALTNLPPESIVFVLNAHRYIDPEVEISISTSQALLNLRNPFKVTRRSVVLLGPVFRSGVASELRSDMMLFVEDPPTPAELGSTIDQLREQVASPASWSDQERDEVITALQGFPTSFSAEQTGALTMDIETGKFDVDAIWYYKRRTIESTPGLTLMTPKYKFKDIGGHDLFKEYFSDLDIGALVYIDEIEKLLGGAGTGGVGDNTGVSQDQLGVLLRSMEDYQWTGCICVGPPGSGKSLCASAICAEFDIPGLAADLGRAKSKFVGESENLIRDLTKAVYSMAGERAFVIATCNNLSALPPELLRRFTFGVWYFDLPVDGEEADSIWKIQRKAFGIPKTDPRPAGVSGWTGAEIRNCFAPTHKLLGKDLRWREAWAYEVGDVILGFDEHGPRREYRPAVILDLDYATKKVFKVELASGQTFIVTKDHQFLCRSLGKGSHWKRTDELQRNFSLPRLFDPWVDDTTYDAGWLAGMLDGEGCLESQQYVSVGQNPGLVLDRLRTLLNRRGFSFSNHPAYGRKSKKTCRKLRINGGMAETLRLLGSVRPERLLGKVDFENLGRMQARLGHDPIVSIEPAGKQEIIRITTSTGTLVVDGYPHHNCCKLAAMKKIPLQQAAKYIVPMVRSFKSTIEKLRNQADGNFLSTSSVLATGPDNMTYCHPAKKAGEEIKQSGQKAMAKFGERKLKG